VPGTCFLALSAHIPSFSAAYERGEVWEGLSLPLGFTPAELARAQGRPQGLAARWAAKVAAARLSALPWWRFEVQVEPSGAPLLVCLEPGGAGAWRVSLTHEGEVAAAWVMWGRGAEIDELD
jgi:hypothetical protein